MMAVDSARPQCWRCMLVFCAFMVIFICCGTIYSSPITMVVFEKHHNTSYSMVEQSWLGATMMSTMSLSSILSVPVMRFIGCRGAVIIGGFTAALGPAVAVFAKNILQICLTMGILTGVGVGLAFIPAIFLVEMHFPKRGNRLATSIAMCGIGIGVGAYPPALTYLVDSVDWMYCLVIMAIALFTVCGFGLLMQPPANMSSKVHLHIFKESSLAKPQFIAVCFANLIWSFGSAIMYIHLPVFTRMNGHSLEQTAIMLSCIGGLSVFSRGMFRIMHLGEAVLLDTVTSVFCGLCLTAIFTGLFGDFSTKYTGLLSYSMLFGFYCGFWSNFVSQVNSENIGQDVATGGSGFAMLATAFGSFAGPPVAATLYSETDSYKNIFYLSGGSMMFCSLILLAVKLGKIPTATIIRKEINKKISHNDGHDKVKEKSTKLKQGDVVCSSLLTNV